MAGQTAWRPWLRRNVIWVVSGVLAAVIASGVSFGYWYFGQRPIEEKKEEKALKREEKAAKRQATRDAYQDSRRALVECAARADHPGELPVNVVRRIVRQATPVHNRGWRLMQDERYDQARAMFVKAEETLRGCIPLP